MADDDIELLGDINDEALEADRERREGHPSVSEDQANFNKTQAKIFSQDVQNASREVNVGPTSDAPFVRSTPGPDDAPTFSSSEKTAVSAGDEDNIVVESSNPEQVEVYEPEPEPEPESALDEEAEEELEEASHPTVEDFVEAEPEIDVPDEVEDDDEVVLSVDEALKNE